MLEGEAPEPGGRPADGRIVVGVDGSPGARQALSWALAEASLRRASVEVVHAWSYPDQGAKAAAAPGVGVTVEVLEEEALRVVEDSLAGLVVRDDLQLRRHVAPSPASLALVEAAEGADLLVVGARGSGGFAGLQLGSIAQQCAQHTPCPLVIVPVPGERFEFDPSSSRAEFASL
ncbi:MAG TPA: universal stress protein [Acidimicrobiales bacterium]|nr:universal stress protein [Acidimicrobiales bacterium]